MQMYLLGISLVSEIGIGYPPLKRVAEELLVCDATTRGVMSPHNDSVTSSRIADDKWRGEINL